MIHSSEYYRLIYGLKPGRDTDGIIAERVLGYHREIVPKDGHGENGGNEYLVPPDLSKNYVLPPKGPIHFAFHAPRVSDREDRGFYGAMWLWIDVLAERDWQCSLVHKPFEKEPDDRWMFHGNRLVNVIPFVGFAGERQQAIFSFSAHAETIAMAICRGALFSMEGDEWPK